MDGVGVAEEIVQVAEDLLVRPGEEDPEHVRLGVREGVQREARLPIHELVDLAVGVAGDVLQRAAARRLLAEAVDRHDREELVDGPRVGQRLEEREVAEVPVGERRREVAQEVGILVLVALAEAGEFVGRAEVVLLRLGALAQREHPAGEVRLRALLVVLDVVMDLAHATRAAEPLRADGLVLFEHLVEDVVVLLGRGRDLGHHLRLDVDDVEEQQRVVGGERAPRLADQVRHREVGLAAGFGHRVDDVAGVLLERVVRARLRRGVGPVVVDPEAATHVHVRDVEPELPQLGVVARDLLERRLDVADVGDLRPEVKVDQLDDVERIFRLELVEHPHEPRGREPELGLLSSGLRPPPGSLARQLDPDARGRAHPQLTRHLQQHVDLGQLLDHDEDPVPELLPHQGKAHELVVLVAVADDDVIRALAQTKDRLQFRLRARLQPDARGAAELDDLLDHMPLLVDLDREDGGVLPRVVVFLDRRGERLVELSDA